MADGVGAVPASPVTTAGDRRTSLRWILAAAAHISGAVLAAVIVDRRRGSASRADGATAV